MLGKFFVPRTTLSTLRTWTFARQNDRPTRRALVPARWLYFLLLGVAGLQLGARSDAAEVADAGLRIRTEVAYGAADGERLLLDSFAPEHRPDAPARPAILLLHGGGWQSGNKSEMRELAVLCAREGYVSFSVGYRLATLRRHRYPAQLDDVQRAVRWVRAHADEYHLDPQRIGAIGFSAGGHLAALLGVMETRDNSDPALAGYSSRVTCVADVFGPTDFTVPLPFTLEAIVAVLLGAFRAADPAAYRDASPLTHIDRHAAPFLIIHGAQDDIVPVDQARRFYDALRAGGIPAELLVFPDEGHGIAQPANQAVFSARVAAFFRRYLREE